VKLIRELVEDVEVLTEETNGQKSLYIHGPFLQSAVVNRNRRIYSEAIMDSAVAAYMPMIREARLNSCGELGHPQGPGMNFDRISHRIISLTKEGTTWMGKAKILEDQPNGRCAAGLIREGVKLGVSSRGVGTLKVNSKGVNEVQKDFRIATAADIVADPSAPDAWVQGVMEGAEWVWDEANGLWTQRATEAVREAVSTMSKADREAKLVGIFEAWMGVLGR
jgi:hypothetical protein